MILGTTVEVGGAQWMGVWAGERGVGGEMVRRIGGWMLDRQVEGREWPGWCDLIRWWERMGSVGAARMAPRTLRRANGAIQAFETPCWKIRVRFGRGMEIVEGYGLLVRRDESWRNVFPGEWRMESVEARLGAAVVRSLVTRTGEGTRVWWRHSGGWFTRRQEVRSCLLRGGMDGEWSIPLDMAMMDYITRNVRGSVLPTLNTAPCMSSAPRSDKAVEISRAAAETLQKYVRGLRRW